MKIWKQITSVLIIASLVIGGVYLGDRLTTRGVSRQKYIKFFEEHKEYDVLFYGSSHVLSGVQPMELWDKYGITSYNLGGHAASLGMSYWVLRQSLKYHKPKVAVLDIYDMYAFDQPYMDISFMHYSMDAYPAGITKFNAVQDLLGGHSTQEKMELLFPFSVYHSRWNEITPESARLAFDKSIMNSNYGSEVRYGVAVPPEIKRVDPDITIGGSEGADEYIRNFVSICREAGVEVCFMRIPYPASQENQMADNRVMKLAEELSVRVIDLMQDDKKSDNLDSRVVNWDTDFVDANAHLNAVGAYKATMYLGQLLRTYYGFTDKRNDEAYSNWNTDFRELYLPIMSANMAAQSDFKTCLMMAAYPEYETEITATKAYDPDEVCEKLSKLHGDRLKLTYIAGIDLDNVQADNIVNYDLDGEPMYESVDISGEIKPVLRMTVKERDTGKVVLDKMFVQ
ncbi:hypothetical protein [Oribacterium sp. WCC10]|uniref:hypothetical protein n=1 Tax=Oribacterium sp. WCC10 TaxID=1855343 RepID=UPI0008E6CD49|nr:hypothetical protein [Oribacterium sp. WCC10]SFG26621.1 hypothetical protein SAMN05216356_104157 [Oribacterium sp. WCC10]